MENQFAELEAQLASAQTDSDRLNALNALAWALYRSDAARALALSQEAYELAVILADIPAQARGLRTTAASHLHLQNFAEARSAATGALAVFEGLGDGDGVAAALSTLGLAYSFLGDSGNALAALHRALTIVQAAGDETGEADLLNRLAVVYWGLDDYATTLDFLLKSLSLSQAAEGQLSQAILFHNIGLLYERLRDYDNALTYLRRSLAASRAIGDRPTEGSALKSIGDVYSALEEWASVNDHYRQSLQIYQELDDHAGKAEILDGLGALQQSLGNLPAALALCQQGLDLRRRLQDRAGEAGSWRRLGELYVQHGDMAQGLVHLQKALALAEEVNSRYLQQEAHRTLAAAYKQAGNPAKALHHFEQFYALEKELFSEESDRRIKNLQVVNQVETIAREAEIHRLKNVELKTALDELQALSKEKDEFLAIAAHDLKNPLTGILTAAYAMQDALPLLSQEEIALVAQTVIDSAERMIGLIVNLLDVNALAEGKLRLKPEAVDLSALALEIALTHREKAQAKSIELKFEIEQFPLTIWGDKFATAQILDNLISNAVKYSPPGRVVTMRLNNGPAGARCSVADQGPGLSDEDKQKLFSRFARLSARPTGSEHSTGLGLFIAKKMAEAMNGQVWCESEPGQGATFIVELPHPSAQEAAR